MREKICANSAHFVFGLFREPGVHQGMRVIGRVDEVKTYVLSGRQTHTTPVQVVWKTFGGNSKRKTAERKIRARHKDSARKPTKNMTPTPERVRLASHDAAHISSQYS
jgi:hypothetical protein